MSSQREGTVRALSFLTVLVAIALIVGVVLWAVAVIIHFAVGAP